MKSEKEENAEELLEKIFFYMNQLAVERDFYSTVVLLTDLGRTLVRSERASFWYWDKQKKQYWTIAALGSERIIVPEGTGIIGASIERGETILINSPYQDSRFNPEIDRQSGYITKSILCMPVTAANGQIIGAYQAINKLADMHHDGEFDERDLRRMTLAAVYCGKTLESKILYDEAHTDTLTGLKNRRGFYEYYDHQILPMLKKDCASAVMCDIDYFKRVNDVYGHNAGDAVLVYIADIMRQALENSDEVFRWGGEEFVFLLKGKSKEEAREFAEMLRKKIQNSTCYFEGKELQVTMSFGVGELRHDRAQDENIKRVDDKLYQAKLAGRNRVVC